MSHTCHCLSFVECHDIRVQVLVSTSSPARQRVLHLHDPLDLLIFSYPRIWIAQSASVHIRPYLNLVDW